MSTSNATETGFALRTDTLTGLHWVGVALAAITGVVHLVLTALFVTQPMGWAFAVAGVGFLAGIAGVLVDYRRTLLYLLGVPFALGQIALWYVVNVPEFSPLGLFDKAVQVALIAALVVLYRREA